MRFINKSSKQAISKGLIVLLGVALIGCTSQENGDSELPIQEISTEGVSTEEDREGFVFEGEWTPIEDVVASLTYRFHRGGGFEYTEPLIGVPRDHTFYFDMTPEGTQALLDRFLDEEGFIFTTDFIRVYRDSAFTQQVSILSEGDGERFSDFTTLTVGPARNPTFPVSDLAVGGYLFHHGEFNDWGNAQQYFLVQYYCLETALPKERPLVTVFSIASEIPGAPRINFHVTEDGVAGLNWDPVPGATEYAIIAVEEHVDGLGFRRRAFVIDRTKETYWNDARHNSFGRQNNNFILSGSQSIDDFFNNVEVDEEDFLSIEEMIIYAIEHGWELEPERFYDQLHYLGVIAINLEGTSLMSNLIDIRRVNPQIPLTVASHHLNQNKGGFQTVDGHSSSIHIYHELSLAPSHIWINMGDGLPRQYLIHYEIHMANRRNLLGGLERDEEGDFYASEGELLETPVLRIPYYIEGTSFRGFIQVIEYNEDTFEEELLALQIRQDDMRVRTGDLQRNVNLNLEEGAGVEEDEVATHLRDDFEIFASSRLSGFLALQMLNSRTRINLEDFPEASDHEYLVEAWFEAVLQNPLILGARSMQLCHLTGDLLITYDQEASTQQRQQSAIRDRVNEIVGDIIFSGMTDLEMQIAINNFLVEFVTYDFDALENAAANNFNHVDYEFYDSFTAYGILINGVGVCSGYADAFNLLATRAGLESVIVTGFMQGSLPHAWNRVNIDDQWYTLDVTNNDNEFFPNAFFNLSDDEAASVLTEDTQWMLNRELPRFVATSDALAEYYRYNNRFFNPSEVVNALVEGVNATGRATYRTDVMLTEEQFRNIMEEVIRQTGNRNLVGGHFLGVITVME